MCVKKNRSLIIATVFVCISLVLHTTGFSAEYWASWSSDDMSVRTGLWRTCKCTKDNCECIYHDDVTHWFKAVQAMMCIGFIGQVLTAALAIATVVKFPENEKFRLFVFGSSIASGIIIWIGLIVYILEVDRSLAANVDFSVFLCAAGGILSAMSACSFGTGYVPRGSLPPKVEEIAPDA